jgi:hypothetical protein
MLRFVLNKFNLLNDRNAGSWECILNTLAAAGVRTRDLRGRGNQRLQIADTGE